jgi:plasmid stabilization system protein ParE
MHVVFTPRAKQEFNQIRDYIQTTFGVRIANRFVAEITSKLDLLLIFPEIGRFSNAGKQIRTIKATKFTVIYYRLEKERIIVFSFFDPRRNPKDKP